MRLLPAILLGLLLAASPAAAERPASQVIVELGWALPYGDLGDDFLAAPLGFGATDGLEAGFRWRLHLSPSLSLAPAFHFTNYGNFSGTDEVLGDYRLECTTYRYTVEALLRGAGPDAAVRPFLGAAAGLFRNRAVGFTKDFVRSFDESVNAFGASLRAGVAFADLEFSVVYHLNRFSTWRYFRTGVEQDYDWDTLVVRGAWVVPFGGDD